MTLTIGQIERARKNFYAPAFAIKVANKDLVRNLHLEIASVQVNSILNGADRFTFVVNNAFNISQREFSIVDPVTRSTLPEFFEFGAPVEIWMGYGDASGLEPMLGGIVTEISTSFPSSGIPQLTISGYDNTYCMSKGTRSKPWTNRKDSDVVREIAVEYGLNPRVDNTGVVLDRIEQSQESAEQFVLRLARRNGFEFFVFMKDLYFRRPANDQTAVLELTWGRGLMSFSPELRLTEQVTEVEVYGWNFQTKQRIVGRARKGDEPGRERKPACGKKRESGAEKLAGVCKDDFTKLRVREPVSSQQEADLRARAILKRRAQGFVGGRGESIGIPEIRANVNVAVSGLGCLFSTTFYIQQATHTVDTSGYRTSFEVGDMTI
jgi:Bacteriophage probable baseplate hub protein